jgi:hypothetical protein
MTGIEKAPDYLHLDRRHQDINNLNRQKAVTGSLVFSDREELDNKINALTHRISSIQIHCHKTLKPTSGVQKSKDRKVNKMRKELEAMKVAKDFFIRKIG